MKHRLIDIAAFVLGLVMALSPAVARQEGAAGFSSGGDVGLRVASVGLGNRARPGDWAAVQVDVLHRSTSQKPMAIIIRMDVPNDDGDRALYQRLVTTNPNKPVTTWLYARIPYTYDTSAEIAVSAYLPFDQEAGSDTLSAYDPTKPIGRTQMTARGLISPNSGLIGVVGRQPTGVERYAAPMQTSSDVPFTGHELTMVADALTPGTLPDRVHGLRALEALVWSGASAEEQPGKLNVAQADAIREWVASGGHLVVILPIVGQTWVGTPNPLSDIMPRVQAQRHEGFDIKPLRYLFLTNRDTPMPGTSIVHSFAADESAGWADAMPILSAPTGEVLVVRRLVGTGAVTLVGLDVQNMEKVGALRTDALWNRVLGKRLELPTRKEIDDLQNKIWSTNRQDANFERSIPAQINREGPAATGLLAALILFTGFWLVAGPVGFFMLKQRNKVQHSWVAYAGAILVFTAISWGAATALRQRSPDAGHVTVLDHVYGQPCQRARVWANVFLPSYGSSTVAVEAKAFDLAGRPLMPNPALSAWEAPTANTGGSEFPETRTYVVDARSPNTVTFPARSTTRQIQIDWTGAPRWSMPLPQAADGVGGELGDELRFQNDNPTNIANRWTVTGTLTHDLPAPMRDVIVIVNRGQSLVSSAQLKGRLFSSTGVFKVKDWSPKTPLDLADVTKHENLSASAESFLDTITPRSTGIGMQMTAPEDKSNYKEAKSEIVRNLVALSLYSMLAPPQPQQQNDNRSAGRRSSMQTMDLGRWFTQPCVIVIGFVDGSCPVPITVDGQEISTSRDGLTAVRWVYPLHAAPPEIAPVLIESDTGTTGPEAKEDGSN